MTAGAVFRVGEFWVFADTGEHPNIRALIDGAVETSVNVLRQGGLARENIRGPVADLRANFQQGSAEDMAAIVFSAAQLADSLLFAIAPEAEYALNRARRISDAEWADDGTRGAQTLAALVTEAASAAADLGLKFAILQSLLGGLTETATVGRRQREIEAENAGRRSAQARRQLMESYGTAAVAIATEMRLTNPAESKAAIAREIKRRADAGQPMRLPANLQNIERFLRSEGF